MGRGGVQLELFGSGRERAVRPRGAIVARHPLHVTLRCVDGVFLRRWDAMELICVNVAQAQAESFRICELDVEPNHLHLLLEVDDAAALAEGLRRFQSVLAPRVNALLGRTGPVFLARYRMTVLTNPTQVKNALRYVLNNRRHHAADAGRRLPDDWFDPYSSAAWFAGWSAPLVATTAEHRAALALPCPTVAPRTWLLSVGWRRLGLLSPSEIPGGTRRLEQHEAELAHQRLRLEIDHEWRVMRGELMAVEPAVAQARADRATLTR